MPQARKDIKGPINLHRYLGENIRIQASILTVPETLKNKSRFRCGKGLFSCNSRPTGKISGSQKSSRFLISIRVTFFFYSLK
jgi:hypothetical protein